MKGKVIAWSALGLGILMILAGAAWYFMELLVNNWLDSAHAWSNALGKWLGSLPCCVGFFGFGLVICAVFALIFRKTTRQNCSWPTFAAALALSAVGGLGLVSGITLAFLSPTKNPIAFPTYFSLATISLALFLGLIVLYCWLRSSRWSWKGVVLDVLVSFLYLPGFWWAAVWLSNGLNR